MVHKNVPSRVLKESNTEIRLTLPSPTSPVLQIGGIILWREITVNTVKARDISHPVLFMIGGTVC